MGSHIVEKYLVLILVKNVIIILKYIIKYKTLYIGKREDTSQNKSIKQH